MTAKRREEGRLQTASWRGVDLAMAADSDVTNPGSCERADTVLIWVRKQTKSGHNTGVKGHDGRSNVHSPLVGATILVVGKSTDSTSRSDRVDMVQ
jgi:hypothetical protein